jgi:hypothetical protein
MLSLHDMAVQSAKNGMISGVLAVPSATSYRMELLLKANTVIKR